MPKFQNMTEVFKRGNLNMEGFVLSTFSRINGEVWCFIEDRKGNWFIAKESDLVEHKKVPAFSDKRHY